MLLEGFNRWKFMKFDKFDLKTAVPFPNTDNDISNKYVKKILKKLNYVIDIIDTEVKEQRYFYN